MRRFLGIAATGLAVAFTATSGFALMIAQKSPTQRALAADTVVVGKVTAVEKETVEATPFPGATNKVQYKVAVVQIATPLAGAGNLTHIKVGFVPPPPAQPPQPAPQPGVVIRPPIRRPGLAPPELKEGQEYVLFLVKHPEGGFYIMPPMSPPLDAKAESAKKEVEGIKKVLAVVADPATALKAEKPADRAFAAVILATKYRTYPDFAPAVEEVPIPAEESRQILLGLADADWTKFDRTVPNGMQAFYMLGLNEKDGWTPPKPVPVKPGQPAVNINSVTKEAFVKWLAGPGKDYRIKRVVAKKK